MIDLRPVAVIAAAVLFVACSADNGNGSANSVDPDTVQRGEPVVDSVPAETPDSVAGGDDVVQAGSRVLTSDGWGPLRIGMTRAEVEGAAGRDANPNAVGGPDPSQCDEFRPTRAPAGMLVMIAQDTLVRISLSRNTDVATSDGLRVGDSAEAVLAKYGTQVTVTPHKYVAAPAKTITVWSQASGNARRGILYEVDSNEKVTAIRVGGPAIEYVEGCA